MQFYPGTLAFGPKNNINTVSREVNQTISSMENYPIIEVKTPSQLQHLAFK